MATELGADILERLRANQHERTVVKQRVAEIEAVLSDARRRDLQVYDRESLANEKKRLTLRAAELRRLIREDELALGMIRRDASYTRLPGETLTAQFRSLIDRAGKMERVYILACRFVENPTEKNRKVLETAVRKAKEAGT